MNNISSLVLLLIVGLVRAGTIKPAPLFSNTCLFGDDFNYTAGESWHPFLNPSGYDCIKCSCVIKTRSATTTNSSTKNATVKCNRLCRGTTCTESYGKCCNKCRESGPLPGVTYKYQTCTNQKGHKYSHGAVWTEPPRDPSIILKSNECIECSCWDGFITCAIRSCPRLKCINPRSQKGSCCKTCSQGAVNNPKTNGCYSMARFYETGAVWHPQLPSYMPKCLQCKCEKNSVVKCHPLKCPVTKCDKPFRVHPGDCCKVCSVNNMTTTISTVPSPTMPGFKDVYPNCTRFNGNNVYAHGSKWHPSVGIFGQIRSVVCKCLNGNIKCVRIQGSYLRTKLCSPFKYWRIMQFVYLQPKHYFRTLKFALVRYPSIEFYKVRDENKASQSWQVNRWKLKKTLRQDDVIKVLHGIESLHRGRFKETGILRHKQRDGLWRLLFKQCTSNCAAQVRQVDNYLKLKSKDARKHQCRPLPRTL